MNIFLSAAGMPCNPTSSVRQIKESKRINDQMN